MGDLTKLIARVEALTGPDREVDAAIAVAITKPPHVASLLPNGSPQGEFYYEENIDAEGEPEGFGLSIAPVFTASLDAAVALTERVLPGWAFGFDKGAKTCIAFIDVSDFADRFLGARYTAEGPTPAIALILATLKALQAKEVEG